MNVNSVAVIGAGAWGTALAQTLATAGKSVKLWAFEPGVVEDVNVRHVNSGYLPGVALDTKITAHASIGDCLTAAGVALLVVPAQHVRSVLRVARNWPLQVPVIICAKGLETATGKMMSEVAAEELPAARLAVLSGPSFANDVARGLPAALTLACADESIGQALATALSSRQMRLYWSSDITGVELGGAVKNVLAIAAGIVEGRGLGASAHAALVARGFAELRRFGEAMGAKAETLLGLSGLGDLILTCGSAQSRNMSLGRALGQGKPLAEILGSRTAVTEGVFTAAAVVRLAREKHVSMPVAEAVDAIIQGRVAVTDAITQLMRRPLKAED